MEVWFGAIGAVWCIGPCSVLHRSSERAALAVAAWCAGCLSFLRWSPLRFSWVIFLCRLFPVERLTGREEQAVKLLQVLWKKVECVLPECMQMPLIQMKMKSLPGEGSPGRPVE